MATISIKKVSWIAFSLLSLAATTNFAGETDNRLRKLQSQMDQTRTETAVGTVGARTAPRTAEIDRGYQVNLAVDVLYWRPEVANNTVTQSGSFPPAGLPGQVFLPTSGQLKNMSYQWNWGFRVGLGYDFKHDNWDLDLTYTYFGSNARWDKSMGQNGFYTQTRGSQMIFSGAGYAPVATQVQASGSFVYQRLDLLLGRDYFVSSKLAVNPHFGLKSAWIENNESVEYGGGAFTSPNGQQGFSGNNAKAIDNCKSWGIGPAMGLSSSWYIHGGLSVGMNVDGALVYTSYKTHHKNFFSVPSEDTLIDVTSNYHLFIPMVDLFLGLKWETYFNKDKNYFDIALGWETQMWWDQIQRFGQNPASSGLSGAGGTYTGRDLSMQGGTLKLKVSF